MATRARAAARSGRRLAADARPRWMIPRGLPPHKPLGPSVEECGRPCAWSSAGTLAILHLCARARTGDPSNCGLVSSSGDLAVPAGDIRRLADWRISADAAAPAGTGEALRTGHRWRNSRPARIRSRRRAWKSPAATMPRMRINNIAGRRSHPRGVRHGHRRARRITCSANYPTAHSAVVFVGFAARETPARQINPRRAARSGRRTTAAVRARSTRSTAFRCTAGIATSRSPVCVHPARTFLVHGEAAMGGLCGQSAGQLQTCSPKSGSSSTYSAPGSAYSSTARRTPCAGAAPGENGRYAANVRLRSGFLDPDDVLIGGPLVRRHWPNCSAGGALTNLALWSLKCRTRAPGLRCGFPRVLQVAGFAQRRLDGRAGFHRCGRSRGLRRAAARRWCTRVLETAAGTHQLDRFLRRILSACLSAPTPYLVSRAAEQALACSCPGGARVRVELTGINTGAWSATPLDRSPAGNCSCLLALVPQQCLDQIAISTIRRGPSPPDNDRQMPADPPRGHLHE